MCRRLYQFKVLPFGLATACYIGLPSRWWSGGQVEIWRPSSISVMSYACSAHSAADTAAMWDLILDNLGWAGFIINEQKSQQGALVGLDLHNSTFQVPTNCIEKFQSYLRPVPVPIFGSSLASLGRLFPWVWLWARSHVCVLEHFIELWIPGCRGIAKSVCPDRRWTSCSSGARVMQTLLWNCN